MSLNDVVSVRLSIRFRLGFIICVHIRIHCINYLIKYIVIRIPDINLGQSSVLRDLCISVQLLKCH